MEQYIPKSALVAEIERLIGSYSKCPTRNDYEEGLKDGRLIGYKDALHKIDTLEVKEGNLDEQDIYAILYIEKEVWREYAGKDVSPVDICKEVLKRFKTQKEE